MRFPFFRPKRFSPSFPIVPLNVGEEEAQRLLRDHAEVRKEDPESDATIAQHLLVAETEDTRISVGIWDGRVRFTNYLTNLFNDTDEQKGQKLRWFVDYYGGKSEFTDPMDTGFMIFWKNPKRKITIVFGLHMGPVRIIDDSEHWTGSK